jgi:outer membrane scaffolding protein for murein synthesis (MipA/OmpV family)
MKLRLAALASALLAAGHAALAGAEPVSRPLWEVGAGAAVLSMPDYRGSDQQRIHVLPIPYVVYRGEVLKVDREKVRGLLFKTEHLELDMSMNGSVPVDSSNNNIRSGMPNLAPTIEIGPQLNIQFFNSEKYRFTAHTPWRTVVAVDHGHTRNIGWLFNPVLNLDIKDTGPDKGWNLGISGGPIWADARYHDYFYGVQPAYATADRPAYQGKGGYSGAQFTLALSKRYPKLWAGAFLRINDLHGTAFEDSPLLLSKTSYMAGIGLSWVFAQSERQVMSDD